MAEWEPVVGLEIHVHLKTRTKMFCRCKLEYFAEPNTRTCPVCLAHPGALPVANRKAVEWTVKLGLALGCDIADVLAIPPNMAGLPSMSIPCGLSEALPVGLQLVGPQLSENTLFRVGHALERAIAFDTTPERLR